MRLIFLDLGDRPAATYYLEIKFFLIYRIEMIFFVKLGESLSTASHTVLSYQSVSRTFFPSSPDLEKIKS